MTILPFTSIDPSSYNHTDAVEDIREGVVNAIYSYDVLRISGDYHLEKFAPEALSLSSIWSDGFGQKEPVLDIILKYARNWDHNIVILGQLKRDWRNLTLYVIDVRTGSVSEYHVQKGEVESVTRAALSKWLAEHRAGKTH